MPIDPRIPLQSFAVQPNDPMEMYARFAQLRALGQDSDLRRMQIQEAQMRMDDIQRQRNEAEQIRQAARGAIRPGAVTSYNTGEMNVGGMTLPGRQSSVQAPAQFDRGAFMAGVNDINPLAGIEFQNQFAAQDAAQQKAAFEQRKQIEEFLASRSEQERKVFGDFMDTMGRAAGAVKMADPKMQPQVYAGVIGTLRNHPNPLVRQTAAQAPEQWTPELVPVVDQWFNEALPMAELAKKVYPKQTPGVDVPFSPQVAQQKKEIAAAGRAVVSGGGLAGTGRTPSPEGTLPADPRMASLVKQIAEYKLNPQTLSNRGGYREQVLGYVAQYDPTYDQTQFGSRAQMRKDFNSGNAAKNIRSLNTFVQHVAELKHAADALGNRSMPWWNTVANSMETQTGDQRVTRFNAAKTAVVSEFASLLKGTGATDQEIESVTSSMNSSMSPQQLEGTIRMWLQLANGRLQALDSQWQNGMGKPRDFRILTDKSRNVLTQLGYGDLLNDSEGNGGFEQPSGGTVKMMAPNGQMSDVPADQVEHFKAKGAKVVR